MDRALTGGVGAGGSLALVLRLLDSVSPGVCPIPEPSRCLDPGFLDWHWPSIVLGVIIGLCIGPILEAVVTFRIWIYHFALRRLNWPAGSSIGKSSYRLC